ncbi:MAG: cobalamin-dependent protein [Deltaproteobacteria bacterium]|nr:cobalamin-dependent protein [Deltaproteobacteria bacterium]MBW1817865.1 cobalamin-dependent protein [Deltaproteobacteria bacterium]
MERIRFLFSRDDFYHQRGYWVVARVLSDAGIEVILGGIQTPEEIAQTAVHEDVDIIGYRLMDASPRVVCEILFDELKKRGVKDLPIVVGGIISEKDEKLIREMGVKEVFRPFDSFDKLQGRVKALVRKTGK